MVLPTSILSNMRHISEYETPIERQLVKAEQTEVEIQRNKIKLIDSDHYKS